MPSATDSADVIADYVRLTDFRPGIFSASGRALSNAGVPAPLGAAQVTNTYRCYALPSGGLAPLPGNTALISVPAPDGSSPNNGGTYWPSTFQAVGLIVPSVAGGWVDELIFGTMWTFNNGGGQPNQPRCRVYRLQTYGIVGSGNPTADLIYSLNSTANSNQFSGQTIFETRIHPTNNLLPGIPVVVMDQNLGTQSENTFIVWPNPNNPTTNVSYNYTQALNGGRGQVLGHQGRIVGLMFSLYGHPGTQLTTNEQISFTDPANSLPANFGTQNEVFVPEYPAGYGAWGSMSIGELFLVKFYGGGVYVTGDVANPTITRLPAVESTGGRLSRSASTASGFFYPTANSGLYVWNGGNASQKISTQLDDGFFVCPSDSFNYGITTIVEPWQEWVLVSNNWLYDTVTRGWWRLENPNQTNPTTGITSGPTFRQYSRSFSDNIMYACADSYVNDASGSNAVWVYDRTKPASSWSWQSHPIPVTTEKMVDVREVVILAQGQGSVSVTLTAADGTTQTLPFAVTSTSLPQRLRTRAGIQGYNVVARIQATAGSTGPAPVLYELDLGWSPSNLTAGV